MMMLLLWGRCLDARSQTSGARSPEPDSAIQQDIDTWKDFSSHRPPALYLDLDKSVYLPDERIFFTAYILDRGGDTTPPHTLYVVLADPATGTVAATGRYLLQEGVASGSLLVPDSLSRGEYRLMAYTNRQVGAQPPFQRGLSIRSGRKDVFTLTQRLEGGGDSLSLRCRVTTDYGGLAAGGVFRYTVSGDGHVLQQGRFVIDAFGEVRLALPAADTVAGAVVLRTTITRGAHTRSFWTPLDLTPNRIMVRAYPEGGALVDGHLSRIGIVIRRPGGMGIATSGRITEDGQDVGYFQTDAYGLGYADCIVHMGHRYTVSPDDLPPGTYAQETFPEIHATGFTLSVAKGVLRDSLILHLQGPGPDSRCLLLVYNDRDLLYSAALTLRKDIGRLAIPVTDWPGGNATVALFDEDGHPLAARAVYVPYPRLTAHLSLDSSLYHTRSQVTLRLRLTDSAGHGVPGVFSFSSALSSRVHTEDPGIGVDFTYGSGERRRLPQAYMENDSTLETALLTDYAPDRPWRGDTLTGASSLSEDYGNVLLNDRKLRRPVTLALLGSGLYTMQTDSAGFFRVPYQPLIAPEGSRGPILSVSGKGEQDGYHLVIRNGYDSVNARLAASWYTPTPRAAQDTTSADDAEDDRQAGFNAVKTLQRVVVKAGDEDWNDTYSKGCRDYVCTYNVLNCKTPGHELGSSRPVRGRQYIYGGGMGFGMGGRSMITYDHCMDSVEPVLSTITPILQPTRTVYNSDTANIRATEPVTLSTLCWMPLVATDKNGEATLRFFTNDLKGRFINRIQGICAYGVFGANIFFKVE
jgi:hypothetical protein